MTKQFKKFLCFVLIFTMISCTKSNEELLGRYKACAPSLLEKVNYTIKHYKWSYVVGTNLTLNRDSTFYMTTCGNKIKGKWHSKIDTLFLYYEEMTYKKDSATKHNVVDVIDTFKINGEYLQKERNVYPYYTYTKLGKIKPN